MSSNLRNAIAFLGGILLAVVVSYLMLAPAFAAEPETVPVGVLQTQEDGTVTFAIVRLLPAKPAEFQTLICFHEFNADTIRCYAVSTETQEVRYVDLKIEG